MAGERPETIGVACHAAPAPKRALGLAWAAMRSARRVVSGRFSGGDSMGGGHLLKNNSKPVVASPNDTARPLEFFACNYKNNILWNSKMTDNL
jgi:hypothetical protein